MYEGTKFYSSGHHKAGTGFIDPSWVMSRVMAEYNYDISEAPYVSITNSRATSLFMLSNIDFGHFWASLKPRLISVATGPETAVCPPPLESHSCTFDSSQSNSDYGSSNVIQ
jgi:hypothetical protein